MAVTITASRGAAAVPRNEAIPVAPVGQGGGPVEAIGGLTPNENAGDSVGDGGSGVGVSPGVSSGSPANTTNGSACPEGTQ